MDLVFGLRKVIGIYLHNGLQTKLERVQPQLFGGGGGECEGAKKAKGGGGEGDKIGVRIKI